VGKKKVQELSSKKKKEWALVHGARNLRGNSDMLWVR